MRMVLGFSACISTQFYGNETKIDVIGTLFKYVPEWCWVDKGVLFLKYMAGKAEDSMSTISSFLLMLGIMVWFLILRVTFSLVFGSCIIESLPLRFTSWSVMHFQGVDVAWLGAAPRTQHLLPLPLDLMLALHFPARTYASSTIWYLACLEWMVVCANVVILAALSSIIKLLL